MINSKGKIDYKEQFEFISILFKFLDKKQLFICKENEQTEGQVQQFDDLTFYELVALCESFFKDFNWR